MIRLVSTIKWHNYREEAPSKSGKYLTLKLSDSITYLSEWSGTPRFGLLAELEYSHEFDKWNVSVTDGEITNAHCEITDILWWAGFDDIEEVFIEEGKDE